MTGVIATIPRLRFGDGSGAPLAGGSVTTYAAGTTSAETTWQDRALTILNTNPITLDALGSCVVWLDSAKTYKILVKDAAGATLWTQDNIVGGGVDDSVELNAPLIQAAVDQAEAAAALAAGYLAAAQALVAGTGTEHVAHLDYTASNTATIPGLNAVTKVFKGATFEGNASAYTVNLGAGTVSFPAGLAGVRDIYIFWI